jgi:hypothetical protein
MSIPLSSRASAAMFIPFHLRDTEVSDPATRAAAVNALMVYDLAKRVERQGDPYENLEETYHFAPVNWARRDYDLIKSRRNPPV